MGEEVYLGEIPREFGPDCWISIPDAVWLRQTLREAGIQSRLLPTPVMTLVMVQALPNLPRPAGELFCNPEDEDSDETPV